MEKPRNREERPREFHENAWLRNVAKKEARRQKARNARDVGVWFGLGMFGVIGWSVAVPTLIGVAVGVWIDTHVSTPYSWTLMLLFIGVVLGCFNAWYWIRKESRHNNRDEGRET